MEPYEGAEPYIFISYARKDAERAAPLLDALSDAGYRVWYDAGIHAGEYWTKTLAEKIKGCAVFCALFSGAFNASRFCFDETNYAYRKNKTIVPVYLEEMEQDSLDDFYQFLYGRQDLRLYQYESAARFVERLAGEPAFESCKAPEWHKIGQIQWRLSADGVLTIAENEDLPKWFRPGSIPSYQYDPVYGGSTAPWMMQREKIISVVITDDIYSIGDNAFSDCENLIKVLIGDGVTKIGNATFWGCCNLMDVRIPDCMTTIGVGAFGHCSNLTSAHISNGVTEINARTFEFCESLKDVHIPDSVTKIDDYAFLNCHSLTTVRIPDGVTQIGDFAFSHCQSLMALFIPDSVTKIGFHTFFNCESLTNVRIPDSVTKIGEGAFALCPNLESVKIPAGAEVGKYAFDEYTHVTRRDVAQY